MDWCKAQQAQAQAQVYVQISRSFSCNTALPTERSAADARA